VSSSAPAYERLTAALRAFEQLTDAPRTIGAGLIPGEELDALDRLHAGLARHPWLTFNYELGSTEAELLCACAGRLERVAAVLPIGNKTRALDLARLRAANRAVRMEARRDPNWTPPTPDVACWLFRDQAVIPLGPFYVHRDPDWLTFPAPEHIPALLERLCEWLNSERWLADGGTAPPMARAMLRAILAHLYLCWIHPFRRWNGRTARRIQRAILIEAGLRPQLACGLELGSPLQRSLLEAGDPQLWSAEYIRHSVALERAKLDPAAFIHHAVECWSRILDLAPSDGDGSVALTPAPNPPLDGLEPSDLELPQS
jgi:hypothetical protein